MLKRIVVGLAAPVLAIVIAMLITVVILVVSGNSVSGFMTTIFSVPSGTRICQERVVRASCSKVAMPVMTGCGALRLRSQRVAEPCGSRSMSRVLSPRLAKYAARLIASVVLPEPPLGFRTTIRCMSDPTRLSECGCGVKHSKD